MHRRSLRQSKLAEDTLWAHVTLREAHDPCTDLATHSILSNTPSGPVKMSAYDQHQRLRTKGIRLLRKKAYDDAIKTIGDGAVQMLEQKEQGSGCDLGVYLTDIYEQAQRPCDEDSRARLVKIISLAQNDFWRKKVIDAAIKWSVQASGNPAGDSHLRLAIAEVLTKGKLRAPAS